MLARRVCRRDPLPRRLDDICGRGPQLAWGKESAPSKAHSGFRKGERASEGRGCSERGTLNADRRQTGKEPRSSKPLHSWREQQKPAQETHSGHSHTLKKNPLWRFQSADVIAPPTSSPSPWSFGCKQLALKGWDRGINSYHQGRVRYGPPSCHWHKRRHRTLCPRRQAGPWYPSDQRTLLQNLV